MTNLCHKAVRKRLQRAKRTFLTSTFEERKMSYRVLLKHLKDQSTLYQLEQKQKKRLKLPVKGQRRKERMNQTIMRVKTPQTKMEQATGETRTSLRKLNHKSWKTNTSMPMKAPTFHARPKNCLSI